MGQPNPTIIGENDYAIAVQRIKDSHLPSSRQASLTCQLNVVHSLLKKWGFSHYFSRVEHQVPFLVFWLGNSFLSDPPHCRRKEPEQALTGSLMVSFHRPCLERFFLSQCFLKYPLNISFSARFLQSIALRSCIRRQTLDSGDTKRESARQYTRFLILTSRFRSFHPVLDINTPCPFGHTVITRRKEDPKALALCLKLSRKRSKPRVDGYQPSMENHAPTRVPAQESFRQRKPGEPFPLTNQTDADRRINQVDQVFLKKKGQNFGRKRESEREMGMKKTPLLGITKNILLRPWNPLGNLQQKKMFMASQVTQRCLVISIQVIYILPQIREAQTQERVKTCFGAQRRPG